MKKMKYIFVLLLLVVLSCTHEEDKECHEVFISFNPVIQNNTRAVSRNAYPVEDSFGVWAYSLPTSCLWERDSSSSTLFMDNETVSYYSGSWLPSVNYRWTSDTALTFFAYSPAWIHASFSLKNGITIADYDMNKEIDIMFTRPVADNTNLFNDGCVSLLFVSPFSQVSINVCSRVLLGCTLHLKKIYIDEVAYKGTFHSQPIERWITTDDKTSCILFDGDVEVGKDYIDIGTFNMMPQCLNQPIKLVVDIYDQYGELMIADRTLDSSVIAKPWKVGKSYHYSLQVYTDNVTFITDILDDL